MQLVAIEAPTARGDLAFETESAHFSDIVGGSAIGSDFEKVVPHQLIQALPHTSRDKSGLFSNPFVDR